jgi:hypothetical protein
VDYTGETAASPWDAAALSDFDPMTIAGSSPVDRCCRHHLAQILERIAGAVF